MRDESIWVILRLLSVDICSNRSSCRISRSFLLDSLNQRMIPSMRILTLLSFALLFVIRSRLFIKKAQSNSIRINYRDLTLNLQWSSILKSLSKHNDLRSRMKRTLISWSTLIQIEKSTNDFDWSHIFNPLNQESMMTKFQTLLIRPSLTSLTTSLKPITTNSL